MESFADAPLVLREAGFTVSKECRSRPSCFDFAARKNQSLVLVKFQPDIDFFSPYDAEELKSISECTSAALLLVGKKAREKPLEDDTVYTRHEIFAVTPKTFGNIAVQKIQPLIQAGPGGYYVEIDGEAFRSRRQELGFSVGELAKTVGLSRRTLYGYEKGMAKASVTAAYKLMWALSIPVAKSVNIFQKPHVGHKSLLTTAKNVLVRNRILQKILCKFGHCGIRTFKKAPFDFLIQAPSEPVRIVGGIANEKETQLDRRIEEILSVSSIFNARPILITDRQKASRKNIRCISSHTLSKIHDPKDFIENFM